MTRVLITGGASGFGQALAAIYASRGDQVLITDVAADLPAQELPATVGRGEVRYLQLDVRDEAAWEAARVWVVAQWGGLDLLINNAGVAAGGRVDVLPIEDWQWIVEINLLGVVRGCRAFVPLFKQQAQGRIVNVASLAGLVHPPSMGSYNAVKAAVVALSETMLHELAAHHVDVSVICPSFFRTNLTASLRGSDPAMEATASSLINKARHGAPTIAARAVKGIDKGRFLILTHPEGRLAVIGKRYAPPVYHLFWKQVGKRVAKQAMRRDAGRLT